MECRCVGVRIYSKSNELQEHSRARRVPSSGSPCPSRRIGIHRMCNQRIPRLSLLPRSSSVLPQLHHLRHHRFHFWGRLCYHLKLTSHRASSLAQPEEHNHRSRTINQTPDDRDCYPEL
ncbi:hypothetical protein LINGRAPRIM_LOCUS1094 [Linum grandiflorum]